MAGYAACDEELFARRQISDTFGGRRGIRPRPCGEFVDEVVAREDEFFRSDLTGVPESGGVRNRRPTISEGIKSRMYDVHDD